MPQTVPHARRAIPVALLLLPLSLSGALAGASGLPRSVATALLRSGAGESASPRSASVPSVQLPRSDLFTFHSDVFINLHHALYRWGQAGPRVDTPPPDERVRVTEDDVARYRAMDAADREAWDRAVTFYRLDMLDRDLLFDREMVALRDCLVMAGNYCERIAGRDLSTLEILNAAMPTYRRVFWSRHNGENLRWIDEVMPLARRFEHDIAPRVAAAYTGRWPDRRNRVDVTVYANAVGAYTTADGHITVSSILEVIQGYHALELLFHESSHGDTMERPLRRLIERAFDAVGADAPPDLWHMTIFYTAGHVTRQVLTSAGIDYPRTYAEYAGIYERRPANARARDVLDAHWADALAAGSGFEAAMENAARAWSGAR